MNKATRQKTLVFCTAYAGTKEIWEERYRKWLMSMNSNGLVFDQLLIIDDGSPCLPDWPDTSVIFENATPNDDGGAAIYHFETRLGRGGVRDYPGWFRSFCFAAVYAEKHHFNKVMHIESDAFVVSARFARFLNGVSEGWVGLKLPRHQMPESAIQVIAGTAIQRYQEFAGRDYKEFKDKDVESCIPYTHIAQHFKGDRYGQIQSFVPRDADWTVQVFPTERDNPNYFWWIERELDSSKLPTLAPQYTLTPEPKNGHLGVNYRMFLPELVRITNAESYVQVGPGLGPDTIKIATDLLWVSPQLTCAPQILGERCFLFRMSSDRFFAQSDLRTFFTLGIDIAFIDSNHLIEVLITEFAAIERACRSESLIILHDCLPLNSRMAERNFRINLEEPHSTRDFWTGDIWKLLPIIQKYRPEMRVVFIDAPPTGLVICTNLDPFSTVFNDCGTQIAERYSDVTLADFGLKKLWSLFPTLNSKLAVSDETIITTQFPLY